MTAPEHLVSSFTFRSSETIQAGPSASRQPLRPTTPAHHNDNIDSSSRPSLSSLDVKEWEGRVVFTDIVPSPIPRSVPASCSTPPPGPSSTNQPSGQGRSSSPISISSDSSPEKLPRPRARAVFATKASSTAYTPPRAVPLSTAAAKPVHPFFRRDLTRSRSTPPPPPPPSQRPRLVACYSSTSASSSQTTQTDSQTSVWSVGRRTEIEIVTQPVEPLRSSSPTEKSESESDSAERRRSKDTLTAELDAMARDLDMLTLGRLHPPSRTVSKLGARRPLSTPTQLPLKSTPAGPSREPAHKSIARPAIPKPSQRKAAVKAKRQQASDATAHLQVFSYRNLAPPPKVVYTTDYDEANDLLSCLKGNVLGFDMEWPNSVKQWDAASKRYIFVVPKTALLQFSDEKLVVLIQIFAMDRVPSKAVEILQDPSRYKLGVQVKGDGQKLMRDHPTLFPRGIAALLELSWLARAAEPIKVGPGKQLISLAKLVAAFLDKHLTKDQTRTSDWSKPLDAEQIEYAANDVVCSVELFKALSQRAEMNDLNVDLDACSSFLGEASHIPYSKEYRLAKVAKAHISPASKSSVDDRQPSSSAGPRLDLRLSGIPPREQRTVEMFKSGLTTMVIAEQSNIKVTTVQSYLISALGVLPADALTFDEKKRLLTEAVDERLLERNKLQFKQLRRDVGEDGSDDEAVE